MSKVTVYRKCPCGETAHDYTGDLTPRLPGRIDVGGHLMYACRNCGRTIVPKDKRSLNLRQWRIERTGK